MGNGKGKSGRKGDKGDQGWIQGFRGLHWVLLVSLFTRAPLTRAVSISCTKIQNALLEKLLEPTMEPPLLPSLSARLEDHCHSLIILLKFKPKIITKNPKVNVNIYYINTVVIIPAIGGPNIIGKDMKVNILPNAYDIFWVPTMSRVMTGISTT